MENERGHHTDQILGIPFFNGTAIQAVERAIATCGLVVAPSGTCFERFLEDEAYRRAIRTADVVLPDSGFMVSLWRLLRQRSIQRISGLSYLKQLLGEDGGAPGVASSAEKRATESRLDLRQVFWVLPHERARALLLAWAESHSRVIDPADCHIAPIYSDDVTDEPLLAMVETRRPSHVIIAIGAGAQEKLGWYLRDRLSARPAIHCVGGALGFLTGDQVAIPEWADRLYLGWFLRLLSQPRVFIPRLWKGRILPYLIWRYGTELPPLNTAGKQQAAL